MKPTPFSSESGLRPASAFLMIACVLIAVSANAVRIALTDADPPERARIVRSPEPDFDIVDRTGMPLAFSVRCADLIVSPRSAWRAHTPDFMAAEVAAVLGGTCTADELLEHFLPDVGVGTYYIPADRLTLTREQAERVCALLERGIFAETDDPRPLDGIYVVSSGEQEEYLLGWQPAYVLSKECREAQAEGERKSIAPIAWTNRLLIELTRAIRGSEVSGANETEKAIARMKSADRLWDLMLPSGHEVALRDVPLDRAYDLLQMLEGQGLKSHQMELRSRVARAWPQRESEDGGNSLEILGRWGHVGPERAEILVAEDLGYERPFMDLVDARGAAVTPDDELVAQEREFEHAYRIALDSLHPVSGIERSIDRLLRNPEWSFLQRGCGEYRFREFYCARPRGSRRYFVDACASSSPPRVTTTLDLDLQRYLRQRLEGVMEEHDPALAMAIVVDVPTGEILAVDGLSAYNVRAFLPTWHLFTPGSTFKVLVMAAALESGSVTPHKRFDAHDGTWHIPGSGRTIHEAEGETKSTATAAEALAFSLNIVLVQIGMAMEAEPFRAKLVELGYTDLPRAELGTERRGYVPQLPWKQAQTHASVSFGHELSTSLWQHAAGLSTVLRGGDWKALRLLSEVEQDGVAYRVPSKPGRDNVFTQETCIQVREMMYMGAQVGTGRDLHDERVWMGTKTGTTEKVSDELCLHIELQHNREIQEELTRNDHACDKNCRGHLRQIPKPHRTCYTSSICIFGRLPGTERDVMVLLVVDEPRSKEKYGSKVAGPAARDVLFEALGLTQGGLEPEAWARSTVEYSAEVFNQEEHPWAEVVR